MFSATKVGACDISSLPNSGRLSPRDAEAHNIIGVMFKELGRLDDAVANLTSLE